MHRIGISEKIEEMVRMRRGGLRVYKDLDVKKMAMIVVDMQNCFCAPGGAIEVPMAREIVPNINKLAQVCRKHNIPVIWIQHNNMEGGEDWGLLFNYFLLSEKRELFRSELARDSQGAKLWKDLEVMDSDYIVNKCRYSAFIPGSSNLERLLRSMGRDTLIITGTKTNICCESTARDAMMLDFKVVFISNATAAVTDEEHQATLNNIIQSFGDVLTTQELIQEIEFI